MTEKLKFPTLLIISDNPSIFYWFKKNLEDRFYLIEAPNVEIALQTSQFTAFDFIILDSLFEECPPLELSRKLRQLNPAIPIFLITGRLKKSFRDAAIESGVTDFLNDQLSIDEIEMRAKAGQKAATIRKKTSEISGHLKITEQSSAPDFLKNRLLVNDQALRLLAEIRKTNDSITLLLVRADHFDELQISKNVRNPQELLLPLQKRLKETLQPDDLLIPASNGNFIILLPHTSAKEAHEIAEKLRRSIHQKVFDVSNQPLRLTISIVVSPLEANEVQYKKMAALAIEALDEAKTKTNLILSINQK